MVRLRLLLPLAFMGMAVTTTVGCGGGGAHGSYLPGPSPTSGATPPAYSGPTAAATLTLTIPAPGSAPTATDRRSPAYIPASVRSVSILVLEVNSTPVADSAATTNVTPGSAPCSTVTSADYTCTISVQLPIGTDNVQIGTYDAINAGGNLISQTIYSASVVEGHSNTFGSSATPITLDAKPGTITVVTDSGPTGTYPNFTVNGTGTATFTVSVVDAHGTAFGSQPGQPTITHAAATGTGASASMSGTTLSLTPGSGSSDNVVVDADPAGSKIVSTTLSSSPGASATSFTVSSTTSMFVGMNLVLDYETFSGSTLIQETAKITNISGSTITVSTGLAHAHTSGATVYAYSDNLSPSTAPFTVTLSQTIIAPVGINQSNDSKALVYNTSFSLQTGSLTSTTEGFSNARFDTADQLFILDQNLETVYRSQWTAGSGFGSVTTYSGIPGSQAGNIGFDVSSSGAVAVENFNENDSAGTVTPQLDAYAAGSSSGPTGFTSSLGASAWPTVTEFDYPTVAVLSDTSANVFGYAYEICDVNDTSPDKIVVTSGTSEQDLTGSIVSMFASDPTAAVLTWDVGLQALFYANSNTGSGSTYAILEFPHTGSTDSATLSNSPTTIASVAGNPVSIASSQGTGDYVAVAWDNSAGGATISIYYYNGSTWSLTGTIDNNGTTISDFTSMHFIPSGNLIVSNSDSGGTIGQLMEFTTTGSQVGSTYNALADFGSGYTINDVAVSY
jgi:hypothetical protein